jgi:hypothetical protein
MAVLERRHQSRVHPRLTQVEVVEETKGTALAERGVLVEEEMVVGQEREQLLGPQTLVAVVVAVVQRGLVQQAAQES